MNKISTTKLFQRNCHIILAMTCCEYVYAHAHVMSFSVGTQQYAILPPFSIKQERLVLSYIKFLL